MIADLHALNLLRPCGVVFSLVLLGELLNSFAESGEIIVQMVSVEFIIDGGEDFRLMEGEGEREEER